MPLPIIGGEVIKISNNSVLTKNAALMEGKEEESFDYIFGARGSNPRI